MDKPQGVIRYTPEERRQLLKMTVVAAFLTMALPLASAREYLLDVITVHEGVRAQGGRQ